MTFRPRASDYPAGSLVRRQLEAAEAEERDPEQLAEALLERVGRPKPKPATPRINEGETLLNLQLRALGVAFEPEYVFHPTRQWRFDVALPDHRIAIEIEGGIWKHGGGGHSHPMHIERDIEKYNAAAQLGWRVFRFMPDKHVATGIGAAMIAQVLNQETTQP